MKNFRELAKVKVDPIKTDPYADRWYGTLVRQSGETLLMTINSRGFTFLLPNFCPIPESVHDN